MAFMLPLSQRFPPMISVLYVLRFQVPFFSKTMVPLFENRSKSIAQRLLYLKSSTILRILVFYLSLGKNALFYSWQIKSIVLVTHLGMLH